MQSTHPSGESRQALNDIKDIRGIMERSTKFLSLSGMSGIWAGAIALLSAGIAWKLDLSYYFHTRMNDATPYRNDFQVILLALFTFFTAFAGAFYFTWEKAHNTSQSMWTKASRELMRQVAIPIVAGAIFCIAFLHYDSYIFIAPTCLAFYGLALVNGSKYTLGEIRWLGYSEIILGCIALFVPYYGLLFLAIGFGILHIIYGIAMWTKYDRA
ncbi:MAG: hypothetical protein ABI378_11180 [Chitinophagaceae bacterium]